MASSGQEQRTLPVFLINNQLPGAAEKPFSTVEICTSGEKSSGYETIEGAQRIRGLWRIYTKNNESRLTLLSKGFVLRGVLVIPRETNPYVIENGENETPTTKLFIGDLPISYSNEDIVAMLEKLKVKIRSRVIDERARDDNGRLTRFKTGRRMIFIEVPKTPLPKEVSIGAFRAMLFHKEMRVPKCSRCLNTGHHVYACPNPVKCRQCLQDGHVAGSEDCQLVPPTPAPAPNLPDETSVSNLKQPEITELLKKPQDSVYAINARSRSYSPRATSRPSVRKNITNREKRRPSRSPNQFSPQHQPQSKTPRINSPTTGDQNGQQSTVSTQEGEDGRTT